MADMNRATSLLSIALLLAVVFFLALPGTTAWRRVVQDAGHGPVFACIALVLLHTLRREAAKAGGAREAGVDRASYLRALLIAVAIGVVSEFVQYFQANRSVSMVDVVHDTAGAALGLSLYALLERRKHALPGNKPTTLTAWLIALALGSFVLLAWQPIRCATAYAERNRAFPTLLQARHLVSGYFADARAADLTLSPLPEPWRRVGEHEVGREYMPEADDTALRLSFTPGTRPALELEEPAPDWRGYDTLKLDLTNPAGQPLRFTLRIHDATHDNSHTDRFNTPVTIPARSRVTVQVSLEAVASAPRGRRMDMAAVRNVMLFSRRPMPGTEFYVSRLWLE